MTVVNDFTAIVSDFTWNGYQGSGPAFVSYSFDTVVQPYLGTGNFTQGFLDSFAAFTTAEQAAARAAMAQWADASGLVLLEVGAGEGDIRFGSHDFSLDPTYSGAAGFAYYPGTSIDEFGAYRDDLAGDVFVNLGFADNTYVLLHEIGHALGFQHPFDSDPTLSPELDNHANTVMSYTGDYPGVLGVFDLQAVAAVYGGAGTDGTQVASWSWNAATRSLTQVGFATNDTIFGVGGRDIIDGAAGHDRIGGFQGNDSLWGNAGNDTLFGDTGNDTLTGGTGADSLLGGAGTGDVLDYAGSGQGVTVKLFDGSTSGGDAAGDAFSGIENITGSALNDVLSGDSAVNVLTGGGGNDALFGGGGNDRLDGGAGNDTLRGSTGADSLLGGAGTGDVLDYGGSVAGVTVKLFAFSASGGEAVGDTFSGIENITGSALNDVLSGDSAVNILTGGAGHDGLFGGSGNDRLDGGTGNDMLQGATGNDTFVFGAGYGRDRANDFTDGADRVDLLGALTFTGLTLTNIAGGGVRVAITASPATYIDLIAIGLDTGDITAGDFI